MTPCRQGMEKKDRHRWLNAHGHGVCQTLQAQPPVGTLDVTGKVSHPSSRSSGTRTQSCGAQCLESHCSITAREPVRHQAFFSRRMLTWHRLGWANNTRGGLGLDSRVALKTERKGRKSSGSRPATGSSSAQRPRQMTNLLKTTK